MVALLRLARILSLAAVPALAAAVPAGATASLTCEADDRNLSFDLLGNIGSGDGGAIQLLAIIGMRAKSGDSDLGRYRGEYVLKVQGPKGESVLRGRLKDCSAG